MVYSTYINFSTKIILQRNVSFTEQISIKPTKKLRAYHMNQLFHFYLKHCAKSRNYVASIFQFKDTNVHGMHSFNLIKSHFTILFQTSLIESLLIHKNIVMHC